MQFEIKKGRVLYPTITVIISFIAVCYFSYHGSDLKFLVGSLSLITGALDFLRYKYVNRDASKREKNTVLLVYASAIGTAVLLTEKIESVNAIYAVIGATAAYFIGAAVTALLVGDEQ